MIDKMGLVTGLETFGASAISPIAFVALGYNQGEVYPARHIARFYFLYQLSGDRGSMATG